MAESKEQDALLKRINELAHKNKEEGLTEEETKSLKDKASINI